MSKQPKFASDELVLMLDYTLERTRREPAQHHGALLHPSGATDPYLPRRRDGVPQRERRPQGAQLRPRDRRSPRRLAVAAALQRGLASVPRPARRAEGPGRRGARERGAEVEEPDFG